MIRLAGLFEPWGLILESGWDGQELDIRSWLRSWNHWHGIDPATLKVIDSSFPIDKKRSRSFHVPRWPTKIDIYVSSHFMQPPSMRQRKKRIVANFDQSNKQVFLGRHTLDRWPALISSSHHLILIWGSVTSLVIHDLLACATSKFSIILIISSVAAGQLDWVFSCPPSHQHQRWLYFVLAPKFPNHGRSNVHRCLIPCN